MTQQLDGTVICDGCGLDLGNGGVSYATIVSRVDPDTGLVKNYHFCEDKLADGSDNDGCGKKLLTKESMPFVAATTDTMPKWLKAQQTVGRPTPRAKGKAPAKTAKRTVKKSTKKQTENS